MLGANIDSDVDELGASPISPMSNTQFAEKYLEFEGKPLRFAVYEYMQMQINDSAKMRLMVSARQTGKSLAESVVGVAVASMNPYTTVTYISSGLDNASIFESQKLRPIMESPKWKSEFLSVGNKNNVFEKTLNNGSQIVLRGAGNQMRVRGISGGALLMDELQDTERSVVEAAQSTLTRSETQMILMGGTQSHIESSVNHYWEVSSQMERVVFCSGCSKWSDALGEANIGRKSLICAGCGHALDVVKDRCEWGRMGPREAPVSGYRFPLLALPNHPWSDIVDKYDNFTQQMFYLDVLALPYDFAGKPISRAELLALCEIDPRDRWMTPAEVSGYRTVAGIDWGKGQGMATTQICIYVEMGFGRPLKIAYFKKLVGDESEPAAALEAVSKIIQDYNCKVSCPDVGGQWGHDNELVKRFGPQRVAPVQLVGDSKKIMTWIPKSGCWSASKTDSLSEFFMALKKQKIHPPAWSVFRPFGEEWLNELTVYNEDTGKLKFDHVRQDDSVHAANLALLAYGILCGTHTKLPTTGFAPNMVFG